MTISLKADAGGNSGSIQVAGVDRLKFNQNGELEFAPASGFSMRNKIINGKMEIAQRGTSFAGLTGAASYTTDRWQWEAASSAVVTISQQSDVPGGNEFKNSLRVAVTTADTSIASTDQAYIRQSIEGFNARDLIGKTFTLSFWVRSSKTGIHCVALRNAAADRSYVAEYTIGTANTWEKKSITVSGGLITAGTWDWTNGVGVRVAWALAAGSSYQTTAGAWQTGASLATSNQVNCLDTIGNIFAITGVQLEVGSIVTPFEHRPIGTELAMCHRYYVIILATHSNSPSTWYSNSYAPQPMRVVPTLTQYQDSGAGAPPFYLHTGPITSPSSFYQGQPGGIGTARIVLSAEM